jgi:acetate kinase
MKDVILVVNSGSSSLKIAIFAIDNNKVGDLLYNITLEARDNNILFKVHDGQSSYQVDTSPVKGDVVSFMINSFGQWWEKQRENFNLLATGHRIVHGGSLFTTPVSVTAEIFEQIQDLIELAPLHLPYNLHALEIFREKYQKQDHIACFDTAFHTTQPKLAKTFALPNEYYQQGVYRYGFHGLSYQWISKHFKEISGQELPKRTIVGHLGNGCSMCALDDGKSIATSMGFSPVEGLMMGTRCGYLDPGVILYLLNNKKMSPKQIEQLLYRKSGLLGISGESSDIRTLLASVSPDAKFAIDLFVYRIQLEIGRLTAALQGLDCLIFTAGIGSNSVVIRELINKDLRWLGIEIDPNKNQENQTCISSEKSKVKVFVIPTNEEKVIAEEVVNRLV